MFHFEHTWPVNHCPQNVPGKDIATVAGRNMERVPHRPRAVKPQTCSQPRPIVYSAPWSSLEVSRVRNATRQAIPASASFNTLLITPQKSIVPLMSFPTLTARSCRPDTQYQRRFHHECNLWGQSTVLLVWFTGACWFFSGECCVVRYLDCSVSSSYLLD